MRLRTRERERLSTGERKNCHLTLFQSEQEVDEMMLQRPLTLKGKKVDREHKLKFRLNKKFENRTLFRTSFDEPRWNKGSGTNLNLDGMTCFFALASQTRN